MEFQFVIMTMTTEVRVITKVFPDQMTANAYGHDLNRQLKVLGLRAKWGTYKRGFAVPDNTKYCEY